METTGRRKRKGRGEDIRGRRGKAGRKEGGGEEVLRYKKGNNERKDTRRKDTVKGKQDR